MKINNKLSDILPINNWDNYYVVSDFDWTITSCDSETSWSIISIHKYVPKSYIVEDQELYDKYRPIEIDESLDCDIRLKLVDEWYRKNIELFAKYGINEQIFDDNLEHFKMMKFRNGALDFLNFLHDNNIPLIIISAGIGNSIEAFLKNNNCFYDNIYIISNKILFKDGIANGISNNLIHSLNKNEIALPDSVKEMLSGRNNVLLLGDQLTDINMVDDKLHDKVIKVGFYSTKFKIPIDYYINNFDIVCEDLDDYYSLMDILLKKDISS